MKSNTHPTYFNNCQVTCTCGNTFETGSILETVKVDICGACHPFYTGEMKFIDIQGRVEKFQARMNASAKLQAKKKDKLKKHQAPKSLKEMLSSIKASH